MALRPKTPKLPEDKAAQREAAQQDVFLREVDDAMREDQMANFGKRWGVPIGLAVFLGLASLAGYLWYENHQKSQSGAQSEEYVLAIDQVQAGNLAAGATALTEVSTRHDGTYSTAADVMRAGVAAQQDKPAEAAKLFASVAADSSAPQALRDLATIREVALQFDAMKPDVIVAKLKPLAVPGNPWFGSAGELLGAAYVSQGKSNLAGPLYGEMAKDETVPATIRSRARQLAGQLGVDAIDDVEETVATSALSAPAGPEQ